MIHHTLGFLQVALDKDGAFLGTVEADVDHGGDIASITYAAIVGRARHEENEKLRGIALAVVRDGHQAHHNHAFWKFVSTLEEGT